MILTAPFQMSLALFCIYIIISLIEGDSSRSPNKKLKDDILSPKSSESEITATDKGELPPVHKGAKCTYSNNYPHLTTLVIYIFIIFKLLSLTLQCRREVTSQICVEHLYRNHFFRKKHGMLLWRLHRNFPLKTMTENLC